MIDIDDFLDEHDLFTKPWFLKAKETHNKGLDHVNLLGIRALHEEMDEFYNQAYDRVTPYNIAYRPNPFRFQYDLFVHLWLNFDKILKKEVKILRKEGKDDKANESESNRRINGISREDAFFAASELRWPTTIERDGARKSKIVRDPWAERRIKALSHPTIKYVAGFGGGGQGKTTVFSAFALMMFEHFLFTEKGARCMISTTNKDKLESVAWPYITALHRATEKGISLYAGRSKPSGDYTIKRPNIKDTAGVFKGLLLGNQINENTIIDKLTGSHGHPFIGYILDEATSTPQAPIHAAKNFTLHAKDSRIMLAGNFGEDGDTLETNIRPSGGWKGVDEETGEWTSRTVTGQDIIVLHFNNNLSPGMSDKGHAVFPHLPSKKNLDEIPDDKRNMGNLSYRRFWVGWRSEDIRTNVVISSASAEKAGADQELILINPIRFFSFDSAQSEENDRNLMMICEEGLDSLHNQRIFGPKKLIPLEKSTHSIEYLRQSTAQLLHHIKEFKIESGNGIVDWTGRPGHAEQLHTAGFLTRRILYNKGLPDGKSIDKIERRVLPEIKLNIQVDFKPEVKAQRVCAHHIAETCIDFAAWLCRTYVEAGRLRGLTPGLLRAINARSPELEFYSRRFYLKPSFAYGDRFRLTPKSTGKDNFRDQFGFSPDVLDCLFQACYFAFIYRNIPLTPIDSSAKIEDVEHDLSKEADRINEIWGLRTQIEIEPEPKHEMDLSLQTFMGETSSNDYWSGL